MKKTLILGSLLAMTAVNAYATVCTKKDYVDIKTLEYLILDKYEDSFVVNKVKDVLSEKMTRDDVYQVCLAYAVDSIKADDNKLNDLCNGLINDINQMCNAKETVAPIVCDGKITKDKQVFNVYGYNMYSLTLPDVYAVYNTLENHAEGDPNPGMVCTMGNHCDYCVPKYNSTVGVRVEWDRKRQNIKGLSEYTMTGKESREKVCIGNLYFKQECGKYEQPQAKNIPDEVETVPQVQDTEKKNNDGANTVKKPVRSNDDWKKKHCDPFKDTLGPVKYQECLDCADTSAEIAVWVGNTKTKQMECQCTNGGKFLGAKRCSAPDNNNGGDSKNLSQCRDLLESYRNLNLKKFYKLADLINRYPNGSTCRQGAMKIYEVEQDIERGNCNSGYIAMLNDWYQSEMSRCDAIVNTIKKYNGGSEKIKEFDRVQVTTKQEAYDMAAKDMLIKLGENTKDYKSFKNNGLISCDGKCKIGLTPFTRDDTVVCKFGNVEFHYKFDDICNTPLL